MAYPPSRSCNADFVEGATDGAVWKPTPDRGGFGRAPAVYPPKSMAGVIWGRQR